MKENRNKREYNEKYICCFFLRYEIKKAQERINIDQ